MCEYLCLSEAELLSRQSNHSGGVVSGSERKITLVMSAMKYYINTCNKSNNMCFYLGNTQLLQQHLSVATMHMVALDTNGTFDKE